LAKTNVTSTIFALMHYRLAWWCDLIPFRESCHGESTAG
jgi:hypothetical protein